MGAVSVNIRDDGTKYIWLLGDDIEVEINHGEILKDLLYLDKEALNKAYSELITKLQFESTVDAVGFSSANERLLRIYARLSTTSQEEKIYEEANNAREAYYLAQTVIGYRMDDDVKAVIEEEHLIFLSDLIACDLYNISQICKETSSFNEYLPKLFSIKEYTQKLRSLLLNKKLGKELEQYCTEGRIETGFSIKDDSELYYITSLDQFIRLEIRNWMTQKSHNFEFFECEVCGRLFARGGSGSYKKVRCSYPYSIPCNTVKDPLSDIEAYTNQLVNRIHKHEQRKRGLFDNSIDWADRAKKRIQQLLDEGNMSPKEIIEYMEGNTWWGTVRTYFNKAKGIDWSQY